MTYSLFAIIALIVTAIRGAPSSTHTTFRIFRQSFWHLLHGTNLYAHYPTEQGAQLSDLFKYSPTAAALFGPFAVLPYPLAMLLWSLLNGLGLCLALDRLFRDERAQVAQWLLLPEAYATMEAMQSNAVLTGLVILGFVALERREQLRGALAIVAAASLKIYPAGALLFGIFHPRRVRFTVTSAITALAAILLPLLLVSPSMLLQQYRWWFATESHDAADLSFGLSVMKLVRQLFHVDWPNWPMQVAGAAFLLAPLLTRRERWREQGFRLTCLASLLAFSLVFNHQAERASCIVGVTGVVIWYLAGERGFLRTFLLATSLLGLQTVPVFAAWIYMQRDLWRRTSTPTHAASSANASLPSTAYSRVRAPSNGSAQGPLVEG